MKTSIKQSKYGYYIPITSEDYKTKEKLNSLLNVKFAKCEPPTSEFCQIEIKYAFFSNYKNNKGEIINQLIIMNYDFIKDIELKEKKEETTESKTTNDTKMTQIDMLDEDLPF